MRIASQLVRYREAHHETQESLASKLHVTRQAVSKWERGICYPDLDALLALSKLYGVSLEELVKGDGFFSLPFDVGLRFTRKQMIWHMLLVGIGYFAFTTILSAALSETYALNFILLVIITIVLFPFVYAFAVSKYTRRYTHWQIARDGFHVYHPTFKKRMLRSWVILVKGDDLSLYTCIPYNQVTQVRIVFKKHILNPRTSLTGHPGPFMVHVGIEPFYVKVVANGVVYFNDMIIDYIRNGYHAYFFLPDIIDFLKTKGITVEDPYDFAGHSKTGQVIHDYVYEMDDLQPRLEN